jgi:hypothetical protein
MGEAFDAACEELRCTSQPEVMSTRHPADVRWMQYSTCNRAATAGFRTIIPPGGSHASLGLKTLVPQEGYHIRPMQTQ